MFSGVYPFIISALLIITAYSAMQIQAQVQPQRAPIDVDFQCKRGNFSNVNIVLTPVGDIRVVGRITNNWTQTLEGIVVVSEFFDRNGRLIEVLDVYPSLTILQPKETTPFRAEPIGTKVNDVGSVILSCAASYLPQPQVPSQQQQQNSSGNLSRSE